MIACSRAFPSSPHHRARGIQSPAKGNARAVRMQQQQEEAFVAKRAFLRAVRDGDLTTIERFFAQPAVVQAALDDEARIQARQTAHLLQPPRGGPLPWYVGVTSLIFVDEGVVAPDEVFAWFFCGPFARRVPCTLAAIALSGLLTMLSEEGAIALVELVVTSPVFQDPFVDAAVRSMCLGLSAGIAANARVLDVLLAHGAVVSVDMDSLGALGAVSERRRNREETVAFRVKNGATIVGHETIIGHAIVMGASARLVRLLITLGADARSSSPSPIHRATTHGTFNVIRTLITHGVVNIEAPHSSPQSAPLLVAVYDLTRDDFRIRHSIWELVAGGADPNVQGPQGQTPLHIAVARGGYGALLALLLHGADPNITCARGRTPLHVAAETADADVKSWHFKHLLHFHADPTIRDDTGATPLHLLAARPRAQWMQDAISRLVRAGADLLALDGAAQTPLQLLQRDATGRAWADALLRQQAVASDQ